MQAAIGEPFDPRAWVRVTRAVLDRITSGELQPGAPVPSIADLAREFGVGRNTGARAYRELASRGIIRRAPGRGYYNADEIEDLPRRPLDD